MSTSSKSEMTTADDALLYYQNVTRPQKLAETQRKAEEERQRKIEVDRDNAIKAEESKQAESAFKAHYQCQLNLCQPAQKLFEYMYTQVSSDKPSQDSLMKKIAENGDTSISLFYQKPWMVGGYSSAIPTPDSYNQYQRLDGTLGSFEEEDIDAQFVQLANTRDGHKTIVEGPFAGWKIYVKYSRKYVLSTIFKTFGVFYGSSFPTLYNVSIVLEK